METLKEKREVTQKAQSEYIERLNLWIEQRGLVKTKFFEKAGLRPTLIYDINAGRAVISIAILQKIKEAYPEFDVEWFITGRNETVEKMRDLVASRI